MFSKAYPRFLNVLLVLFCLLFFDNCRRRDECEGSPKSNLNYDSTHFDSSEQAKIPDWQGDSLYFYSDAGDTAYMYCNWQSPPNNFEIQSRSSGTFPCPYLENFCYPFQQYNYHSNEPTLNDFQIIFFKESNLINQFPKEPPKAYLALSQYDYQLLSDVGFNNLTNDSVLLMNGLIEKGWSTANKTSSLNLNVGILKLNIKRGKKWTLFKYKLNN